MPYGAKAGFGRALAYAVELGAEAIEARIVSLAEQLRDGLGQLEGVDIRDTGRRRCGIVTFTVAGTDPATVSGRLRDNGINTGAPDVTGGRLDLESRGVQAVVRVGVHYYNTEDEVDRLITEVAALN